MQFEWLLDEVKGHHLLCVQRERSVFLCGTLSREDDGRRFWQPFSAGASCEEVYGDLQTAKRQCETIVRQLSVLERAGVD
jgi:hypothetical protein